MSTWKAHYHFDTYGPNREHMSPIVYNWLREQGLTSANYLIRESVLYEHCTFTDNFGKVNTGWRKLPYHELWLDSAEVGMQFAITFSEHLYKEGE